MTHPQAGGPKQHEAPGRAPRGPGCVTSLTARLNDRLDVVSRPVHAEFGEIGALVGG